MASYGSLASLAYPDTGTGTSDNVSACHQRVHTRWGYAGNGTRIVRSTVQSARGGQNWCRRGRIDLTWITPGNVKNRFDLELFGRSEISTIYTSLHEHSQNHPILLSLHFHSELLECLQHFGTPRDHFRSVNWPVGGHLVLKFRG